MWGWLQRLIGATNRNLRAVPGASAYRDASGRVIYNMLDPWMQKFMGQCVGAIKKAGIRAKGTGQFSVLLGEDRSLELPLDEFWRDFAKSQDPAILDQVVVAARKRVAE